MGGGSKSSTTTSDPWATMPDWMKESYQKDAAFREDLLGEGKGIADWLAENPREILGPSEGEMAGLEEVLSGGERADDIFKHATDRLGGDYESEYTDSVVDTTLEGIQRQHERDRLKRDARAAAVGGTGNTRAAVGEAVAEQLTGMNMAEMEAKLRDEAHRFGSSMGLEEAALADKLASSELGRSGIIGSAMSGFGELERGLDQQAMDEWRNSGKDATSWLAGLFQGTQGQKGPVGGTQTETKPGPNTFSQILGAGSAILGGFLSDEDAKEDFIDLKDYEDITDKKDTPALDALREVKTGVTKYKRGLGHRPDEHMSMSAQSLTDVPGATIDRDDGFKGVDPYPVLATVVQAVKELDAERAA